MNCPWCRAAWAGWTAACCPNQAYDLFIGQVEAAWADERVFLQVRWHFDEAPDELRTLHHVAGGQFIAVIWRANGVRSATFWMYQQFFFGSERPGILLLSEGCFEVHPHSVVPNLTGVVRKARLLSAGWAVFSAAYRSP